MLFKKNLNIMLVLLISSITITQINPQTKFAVIIAPVADLISTPAQTLCNNIPTLTNNFNDYYWSIPLAPINKDTASCPRLHQALFNELVEVVSETPNEAQVRVLNAYYLDPTTKQKSGYFWTLKTNLISLDRLNQQQDFIPKPINYKYPNRQEPNVVTLNLPWLCPATNQTFSAGTRFKIDLQDGQAYIYQPATNNFIKFLIPADLTINTNLLNHYTLAQKRELFVKLVQDWSKKTHKHAIPYTWGGCSFIQKQATHKTKAIQKADLGYYAIPPHDLKVQTGLDCSGLVFRAAQAAGLPYFYKNTTTLAHELKPLTTTQAIEPGDLIWITGHVIIIIDPQSGICAEARDFGHGYGKVQQIHISQLFKGITSLDQVKAAHLSGEPLLRVNLHGDTSCKYCGKYQVKILKLA